MATWEYTLTGFSDFLEQRNVSFTEPMDSARICSVCSVVPCRSIKLPCGHVLCQLCRRQVTGQDGCPVDGSKFTEADLVVMVFKQTDLEQHRVLCIVGGQKCGFSGKLCDLNHHVAQCGRSEAVCGKCHRLVDRSDAVSHYRHCRGEFYAAATNDSAVTTVAENIVAIRNELEALRHQIASEITSREAVVNGANTLIDRIAWLQSNISQAADVMYGAQGDRQDAVAESINNAPIAPGPYRAAVKPGVYIATCKFVDVYSGCSVLNQGDVQQRMLTEAVTMAGYTFKLACEFFNNEENEVRACFAFILRHGEWDDHVDWPFRKKVTLTVAHPRYIEKDINLPISVDHHDAAKKPAPTVPNSGSWTEALRWKGIEEHGYIANRALYVNVQFE